MKINDDLLKVHPILLWIEIDVSNYIKKSSLPSHPLQNQGLESIGCFPCTKIGSNRSARWQNLEKNECELHLHSSSDK